MRSPISAAVPYARRHLRHNRLQADRCDRIWFTNLTLTLYADSPLYLLLEASAGAMSFGQATFYIHKRSDESYRCDMTDKDAVDMFMREKLYDE